MPLPSFDRMFLGAIWDTRTCTQRSRGQLFDVSEAVMRLLLSFVWGAGQANLKRKGSPRTSRTGARTVATCCLPASSTYTTRPRQGAILPVRCRCPPCLLGTFPIQQRFLPDWLIQPIGACFRFDRCASNVELCNCSILMAHNQMLCRHACPLLTIARLSTPR